MLIVPRVSYFGLESRYILFVFAVVPSFVFSWFKLVATTGMLQIFVVVAITTDEWVAIVGWGGESGNTELWEEGGYVISLVGVCRMDGPFSVSM